MSTPYRLIYLSIYSDNVLCHYVVSLLNSDFQCVVCSGAASEAGDGAQRGGPKQREAAEEPPGAHRVHTHAEDHADLHTQPLQGECVSVQLLIYRTHTDRLSYTAFFSLQSLVLLPLTSPKQHLVFVSLTCFVSPGDMGETSADFN